jgi:hypothetical protein
MNSDESQRPIGKLFIQCAFLGIQAMNHTGFDSGSLLLPELKWRCFCKVTCTTSHPYGTFRLVLDTTRAYVEGRKSSPFTSS